MNRNTMPTAVFVLLVILCASGCCSLFSKPCCGCFAQAKPERSGISDHARMLLDRQNRSLSGETDLEVRLAACTTAISLTVVPEIAANIDAACASPDLSEKECGDCMDPECKARLKAERGAGLTDAI